MAVENIIRDKKGIQSRHKMPCLSRKFEKQYYFVPIEVGNYDYTGRNIAVPALSTQKEKNNFDVSGQSLAKLEVTQLNQAQRKIPVVWFVLVEMT